MNSEDQTAIEELEQAVMTWWALQGQEITLPSEEGQTMLQRIDQCTQEIQNGN